MRHLAPEQLLDIVEGVPADASLTHLRACDACRAQVDALSSTLSKVSDVEVPEPSPLFWDHLSARIRGVVAAEAPAAHSSWGLAWGRGWSWSLAGALGVVLLAAGVTLRPTPKPPAAAATSVVVQADDVAAGDDASLRLLADLAVDLDWDGAAAAGLAMQVGSVDRVVVELTVSERVELQKLLTAELAAARRTL